jgi:16S rRNA (cytidine1402-2'-O)-methyltransferase
MYGDLYIVSTPIGNLDDITIRALNVLKNVDFIFAESVERTKSLLSHYDIKKKVISYNKDNEIRKASTIISYLEESNHIALVTDAGTPSISDPGYHLLSKLHPNINVIPIPGASSLSCALSVSKIPMNSFTFIGFLPKKDNDRKKKLNELVLYNNPLCLFESKHRLLKLLKDINEIYGQETQIGIFRELTKVYETIIHDSVSNLVEHFSDNPPKGEFVIIISAKSSCKTSDTDYLIIIEQLIKKKFTNKDIVEVVNLISSDSKKEIYKNVISIRHDI